jgi:hypothetical protein
MNSIFNIVILSLYIFHHDIYKKSDIVHGQVPVGKQFRFCHDSRSARALVPEGPCSRDTDLPDFFTIENAS